MNTRFLLAAIVLSGTLVGFLHYKLKPPLDEKSLAQMTNSITSSAQWQGQIAPDFHLVTTTGDDFDLADNVGKKMIVLNFFATWCGPCRSEMPELNRYYNEHKSEPFVLIAIDDDEKPGLVDGYIDELSLDFPVAIDHGAVEKQYGVSAYPTTVVIGADGKVQSYESGAIANPEVAFDALLRVNKSLLASNHAISPDDYRRQSHLHPALPIHTTAQPATPPPPDDEPKLDDRGRRIAARMGCPCGCAQTVEKCACGTAKNIRNALATEDFKNTPDDQIIRGLNNRFCVGPSGSM